MDTVMALAVTAGILMAAMYKLAPMMSVSSVICMIAFGVYFGAGGKLGGLIKTLASLLAGAVWAILANILVAQDNSLFDYRWLLLGVVALIVVLQSKVSILSYIPGGLCGAAVATATNVASIRPDGILLGTGLILGSVFAFVAELAAGLISKKA
jgi:hypothetical protein